MIKVINKDIKALELMNKPPNELFYKGNLKLLDRDIVSIVGTRRPSSYTKDFTYKLAKALSARGIVVASGAAMGVDAIAHMGAGAKSTIAVMANGLDIKYPAVNKKLIEDIQEQGLTLSFFKEGFRATKWSFVKRNELVVALGSCLIVTEADLNSGSLRSVEYALKMNKPIYVLTHRLSESLGTNQLLKRGLAIPIYDIEEFSNIFGKLNEQKDEFILYLESSPSFDDAIVKYGSKIYEAELDGIIEVVNGQIRLI